MAVISYDGNGIIPGPFCQIKIEPIENQDGTILIRRTGIILKGKITADKGSPDSTGAFWTLSGFPPDENIASDSRLASILAKQKALKALFAKQGKALVIQPQDGSAPTIFRPRVKAVEFEEGPWFNTCGFTISMDLDETAIPGASPVEKYTEEWNIETLDELKKTYRLTRSVSASAKINYDSSGNPLFPTAWQTAQDFVLNYVGLGLKPARMFADGVLNADSLQAFNYLRSQHIGETEGLFSVNESWVCFDPLGQPPALHEQTVVHRYNLIENKSNISIEGTVTGFEVKDNSTFALITSRWDNAVNKWDNYIFPTLAATAAAYAGITLNPLIISRQVTYNPLNGVLNYHYEFDNSPIPTTAGALTESITVNNHNPGAVFAEIPVLGRTLGPVLQDIGTITSRKRSISIDIQMPPSTMTFTPTAPNTDAIIVALAPVSSNGVFLQSDEESWTPKNGRYTRQSTFVWE